MGRLCGPIVLPCRHHAYPLKNMTRRPPVASRTRSERGVRAAGKSLASAAAQPIEHVVLLMFENRSFDQMLGTLQAELPAIDGVPPGPPTRFNDGPGPGERYHQRTGAPRVVEPDPPHEHPQVMEQLAAANGGFVQSYARTHPQSTPSQRQQVMDCFAPGELPALHDLARHFVVCDRWHAAVPGPTWTNRLFALSGTSLGRLKMPEGVFAPNLHKYQQPSLFRRLREAERTHRIYFGDFPLSLLFQDQRTWRAARRFAPLARLFEDAAGREADFPQFAFIEPSYMWPGANDDHPPHDVDRGQHLLADVYDALRANEALWNKTLLVVTYDEHGGFYDHVVPNVAGAVAPDDAPGEFDFRFDRYGLRVPTVLASPWLDRAVCNAQFDHTSLLRFMQQRFGLGELGRRVAAARNPLEEIAVRQTPRGDTPHRLQRPSESKRLQQRGAAPALSGNQQAILAFSEYLDRVARAGRAPAAARPPRPRSTVGAGELAHQRAIRFLQAKGARLRAR